MKFFRNNINKDIDPDEIFLDDKNIPDFDVHQFEGRIETPIRRRTIITIGFVFLIIGILFAYRAHTLQIGLGDFYATKSAQNHLEQQLIFSERGLILDRNGKELAWNTPNPDDADFSLRAYITDPGFGHVLGFLHYPARDKSGFYYRKDYEPAGGLESYYDTELKGKSGLRISEVDALGHTVSSNTIDPPISGENLTLTIDARLQTKLYSTMDEIARARDFAGGAGGIIDIETGGVLALVSYPEFDPNVMTSGDDRAKIVAYNADTHTPFLNREVNGLYTPGSIVKPIFALGGLKEGVITPATQILSTGSISVPNPYFPDKETVFTDTAHGLFDVRGALAQSSNVFFYEVAGGYKGQPGLGIRKVEQYARLFGYGSTTGIDLPTEAAGVIPSPEWKAKNFNGDAWRIGDTYFTGIGQYGMQITPLEALREAAIVASDGKIVRPHISSTASTTVGQVDIPKEYFNLVQEGMRKGTLEGTGKILNVPYVKFATKTGTAELGVSKSRVNSWVIGFFPYDHPRYAFAFLMERGVKGNVMNAAYTARQFFDWMASSTPEYFQAQ